MAVCMPLWQITGLSPAFLRVNKVLHIRLIQDRQSLVSGRSLIILRWSFIISVTDLFSFTYFIRFIFNAYLCWISWLHKGHLLLLVLNCPIRFPSLYYWRNTDHIYPIACFCTALSLLFFSNSLGSCWIFPVITACIARLVQYTFQSVIYFT